MKFDSIPNPTQSKIAVIGGGVAGSTIALRLSELGIDTTLIEKSEGLVSGPPICHLHAGGNLYRDISDQQCLTLLQQSIDTVKVYEHCINWRPTVIALPVWDKSTPEKLLPRLELLRSRYTELCQQDKSNQVLGDPSQYFRSYSHSQLELLAQQPLPATITCADDWMIPVAKHMDLSKVQFPLYLVQEYGISAFRFSATCQLAMSKLDKCTLKLNHRVEQIKKITNNSEAAGWLVTVADGNDKVSELKFDYLINAAGFKTGELDDMLELPRKRFVEFKSAYVAQWQQPTGHWPEVILHGERGTPQGMAQLTPYNDGFFQIHGMTELITLFNDGLAASNDTSAQPKLAEHHLQKINLAWDEHEITLRTQAAIDHVAQFLPGFNTATLASKPLYGAQQIPGDDPSLRAADVSFDGQRYARAEIVKASSALSAADQVLKDLINKGLVGSLKINQHAHEHYFPVTSRQSTLEEITQLAENIAEQRDYPRALAQQITAEMDSNDSQETDNLNSQFGTY